MAEKRITEAQFSMQCSFIAKNAAAWAGDILTLPENYNREAATNTVSRFTDEMRGRLDRLDAWAGRSDAPRPGWPIETDDQVEALARECEWDNRKHMTPADYSIWCERMRKFARLASSSNTSGKDA